MDPTMAPTSPAADQVIRRWKTAVRTTEPADRLRAEAAVRDAYRIAELPEPTVIWCPSPAAALEHVRHLIDRGRQSYVDALRRRPLNDVLSAVREPVWQQTSEIDRVTAFGDFHFFFESSGYYGEQRYDGMEERYDLRERPYRCHPVTDAELATLRPLVSAVRQTFEDVTVPLWRLIDPLLTHNYHLQPVWYWDDNRCMVDQDDEARAVVRYALPDYDDQIIEAAWRYWPDPIVLAAIDSYPSLPATHPLWRRCREIALVSGPWWPLTGTCVMTERPAHHPARQAVPPQQPSGA
ncbi:hypothetical protein [Micromonospora sp. NPDC049497]|uniref:hypothetical protein n=1 Tax=Micromonospora sp. NPDC049497 TaxID=3364273 RepID=UPI00378C16C9